MRVLFSESEIAARIAIMAGDIAAEKPQVIVPILVGAFVFAADLMRALAKEGLDLEAEFIWLRSYGLAETPGDVTIIKGPGESVRGKRVLLVDGVLDSGATLARAMTLLEEAGAKSVRSAVIVEKPHKRRMFAADHVGFQTGPEFLFGYGMDATGVGRGWPDIRVK